MQIINLYYKLIDGAYLVSGRDKDSLGFGCMALHKDLEKAVTEIRDHQIPTLAKLNHNLEIIPEFEIKLIEILD